MASQEAKPCSGCGSTTAERSACPSCGKVFCRPCAEEPYASCCDGNASPGLLEALEAVVNAWDFGSRDAMPWAIDKARAALSRARGER